VYRVYFLDNTELSVDANSHSIHDSFISLYFDINLVAMFRLETIQGFTKELEDVRQPGN